MTSGRLDASLRQDVLDELRWDALVDESQLDVDVSGGVVTLVGTVESYARKLAAQEATRAVSGVRDVIDAIDVRPAAETRPTDRDLEATAHQVLVWDALVPDRDIAARASNGWITLSGEVPVLAQRGEAERAIGHLAGVRGVRNDIQVHRPDVRPDEVRRAIEDALRRRATHRAAHIEITVDDGAATLTGSTQTRGEKLAILGAVGHGPGIHTVCDELRIEPSSP